SWPMLEVEVRCGKGTYIRSIARDLGEKLDCGALVQTLRRTRVGPFSAYDAATLKMTAEEARARLRPIIDAVAEFPRVVATPSEVVQLRLGRAIVRGGHGEVAIVDEVGGLIAIAAMDETSKWLRPIKVF